MEALPHTHLMTLTLDVAFRDAVTVGPVASGIRRIVPVTGGRFEGERLSGVVLPGADWATIRSDGAIGIDVRLTLKSSDDKAIYLAYAGRFIAPPEAMARFRRGEQMSRADYSIATHARFECGDPQYCWLNDVIAVGVGEQIPTGVIYRIFAVG